MSFSYIRRHRTDLEIAMDKLRSLIFLAVLVVTQVAAGCERPLEVRGVEDYCWSTRVEMSEKIHEVEMKVTSLARKKLGMDVNEPADPQKCDYYYCLFEELKLLNPQYDVPCIDRTTNWVKKNVAYNQAVGLLERIQLCTGELANSTMSGEGYYFYADNVDKAQNDKILENPGTEQTKCDISKEYMKCLAVAEEDIDLLTWNPTYKMCTPISNHSDTTYNGHYTVYCKQWYAGYWHKYEDCMVSSISSKSLVTLEACILVSKGIKSYLKPDVEEPDADCLPPGHNRSVEAPQVILDRMEDRRLFY